DDLTVDREAPLLLLDRFGDRGEPEVEVVARQQPDLAAVADGDRPDAVELALVDPLRIVEALVGQHGLHRVRSRGRRRAHPRNSRTSVARFASIPRLIAGPAMRGSWISASNSSSVPGPSARNR